MKPKTVGRVGGAEPQTGHKLSDTPLSGGLLGGAIVLTLDGEMPVEFISPGDRIITRDSGTAAVRAIRKLRLRLPMVRLLAGSLGHTRPDRDVTLLAHQLVLVRDWRAQALFGKDQAMVPAQAMCDGEFITDAGEAEIVVFQIICDAPHVIYADGLELSTPLPAAAAAAAARDAA